MSPNVLHHVGHDAGFLPIDAHLIGQVLSLLSEQKNPTDYLLNRKSSQTSAANSTKKSYRLRAIQVH